MFSGATMENSMFSLANFINEPISKYVFFGLYLFYVQVSAFFLHKFQHLDFNLFLLLRKSILSFAAAGKRRSEAGTRLRSL